MSLQLIPSAKTALSYMDPPATSRGACMTDARVGTDAVIYPYMDSSPAHVTRSWLFVVFGESQSAVLDLADWIARRPCSEPRFPDTCSSKMVNFYPGTRAYDPVRGGHFTLNPCHQKRR
jgi:hypothetical protein